MPKKTTTDTCDVLDILDIDKKIRDIQQRQLDDLNSCKVLLNDITKILGNTSITLKECIIQKLTVQQDELSTYIKDVEGGLTSGFYMMETIDILSKYREILNHPIKIDFMTKRRDDTMNEKVLLTHQYITICKKYYPECVLNTNTNVKDEKVKCKICSNTKEFDIKDDRIYTCKDCGSEIEYIGNSPSFKDTSRINILQRYTYERKVHFKDCVNQYQGHQNSTIAPKVYDDVIQQLKNHGLITTNEDTAFKKVTQEHIQMFLRETGHMKHYEDCKLIYHVITKKPLPNIGYLEESLYEDFDRLTELYDTLYSQGDIRVMNNADDSRKNFLNSQYILLQLLRRHKYPCLISDFNILKTQDRLDYHDEICEYMFGILEWNFKPVG